MAQRKSDSPTTNGTSATFRRDFVLFNMVGFVSVKTFDNPALSFQS